MSIEAVAALSASMTASTSAASITQATALAPTVANQPAMFDSLVSSMRDLSAQMTSNAQAVESLAMGDTEGLHRVIMNLESTKLKFDLALQMRTKLLDAYQELMRMSI